MQSHKVGIVGAGSDIAQELLPMLKGFTVRAWSSGSLDVTDQVKMHRLSSERLDTLISFAGVIHPENVVGGSISAWHKQINVNLIGQFNVAHAALQGNPRCKIILIGSNAARKVHAGWSAYCAAKAGLVMFTQCMIAEGIDAWCLNIGRTATKMRRSIFPDEDQRFLLKPEVVAMEVYQIIHGRRVERVSWLGIR